MEVAFSLSIHPGLGSQCIFRISLILAHLMCLLSLTWRSHVRAGNVEKGPNGPYWHTQPVHYIVPFQVQYPPYPHCMDPSPTLRTRASLIHCLFPSCLSFHHQILSGGSQTFIFVLFSVGRSTCKKSTRPPRR